MNADDIPILKGNRNMAGRNKGNDGDKFAEFINSNGELVGAIIVVVFVVCFVVSAIVNF